VRVEGEVAVIVATPATTWPPVGFAAAVMGDNAETSAPIVSDALARRRRRYIDIAGPRSEVGRNGEERPHITVAA
jgi:hypothetical protein